MYSGPGLSPYSNRSVSVHDFAMVPRADVPRASFTMQKTLKSTFDSGYLVPFFCEEVLPGDTWNGSVAMIVRLATPILPIMDNLYADTQFFFVPNRLVWNNWVKMHGEQANPADSISYSVPQQVCPASGYAINSLQDYFGLPTVGQVQGGATVTHSALPIRMYNLIYNTWYRDQNLINSATVDLGDGPDTVGNYVLRRRGKRHDYFTGCLPWVQKFTAPSVSIGTSATVRTSASQLVTGAQTGLTVKSAAAGLNFGANLAMNSGSSPPTVQIGTAAATGGGDGFYPSNLYADLSTASGITINALRLAIQTQRLLERDARGGTRYAELVQSHFGVSNPDLRLQRPEYVGGGSSRIVVSPIAQTSATGLTGGSTPAGNLSAVGTAISADHGFSFAASEHGYVIGIISVRADLTYQQGLRRHWSRLTRYDYYYPSFAYLGEQAVLNKEIYVRGDANDALTFGYQERWAELRYLPSEITGLFRSTAASTIDQWHVAQRFTSLPTLNQTFIEESPPIQRVVAVGAGAAGKEFLGDFFFEIRAARPIPMYSVPGMMDHF